MQAYREKHNGRSTPPPGTVVRIAVVCSGSGVLFVTAARSEDALTDRLVGFLRDRAAVTLWPRDARHVAELLASGQTRGAVETYFARVGDRWDPEHLYVQSVEIGPSCPAG